MMKNQKSQKKLTVKLLLTALALSVTLFACNNSSQPVPKKFPKVITVSKSGKITFHDEMSLSQKKAIAAQVDTGQVFKVVEKMPQFPGGVKKLLNYLATNIKYPAEARKANIQGRVFIQFVVEKDGSISHVRVLKGIGHGCDKESVAAVKNMPRWIPGKQKGKPVRVEYNLPVKFSLN